MSQPRWGRAARRAVAVGLLLALASALLAVTRAARLPAADLTINNGVDVTTLDPATVTGIPEGRVIRSLFEGLAIKHPRTLAPLPGMAASWETSADGRTHTFHLRREARWTNGDPVTAADFVWSWERLLHPETAAEYAYQLWYVRGARAYSLMPDERLFSKACWVRELGPGRARIGVHGFFLAAAEGETAAVLGFEVGDTFSSGDTLLHLDGMQARAPLGGRIVAAQTPSTAELRTDPYENWLIELEFDETSLAAALASGTLLEATLARHEWFWPTVGIRAADTHTLVVDLDHPTPFFLDLVSLHALCPVNRRNLEEARQRWPDSWSSEWVRPENIVTNGPFRIVERRINDRIRLVKNEDYWDAEQVAMRSIDILAVEHYGTMLNMYLTGGVAWIDKVAPILIPRLIDREDFTPEPFLGSYFYRVNVDKPPFDDRRVRRALALAIDRRAICERVMKAGQIPSWSVVPHGLTRYQRAEMEHTWLAGDLSNYDDAFAQDCAAARELLRAAGYGPHGRPFPTIEILYNTAETHRDIAEVVADRWKRELGIDARLLNQEWKVYLSTQSAVDYDVSRSSWIGDYPDANTFLDIWVTGGENNRTGWGDPRYDALIARARSEADLERRLQLLTEAEAILMEELPVLPIYTYATQNMRNPRLGGFHENLLDEHFPKFFYWMDDAELARHRLAHGDGQQLVEAGGPADGLYSPAQQRERQNAQ